MKRKQIFILCVVVLISTFAIVLFTFNIRSKKIVAHNDLINITNLPDEFIDDYFEKISETDSEEAKENMLIIISNSKIKENYGAKNVIEAPNNQYILQYGSEDEKKFALKKLEEDKKIESVEENVVYTFEEAYNSWGIEAMTLNHAITFSNSNIANMKPVTVAIVDSGCDISLFNKYYGGKIVETYNVLEESTTIMTDENGHGTHVAGTIAEGTPDNVKILPIKVSKGSTMYTSDIIAAINYIVRYEKADVINMSFGSYGYSKSLEQAIESANEKNIISVAAAGNDNTDKKHYPSALENTISVASVDSSLNKSTFSNYGAEITFASPGTAIKSIMGKDTAISKRNGNADGDDDHETISGTSMATPHAVSAVAILKSFNKDLTLTNVIDLLKQNSIDLGEEGWDQYYGNGLISFNNVEFCDNTNCDEYSVYKDLNKNIESIELIELKLTNYNYYSLTNIMASRIKVYYSDNTNNEMLLSELPNLEVLNYSPYINDEQEVTIKTGDVSIDINITNPNNYESGWEYNILANGNIELTGYKDHGMEITRLYIPEDIDSNSVVSFADNVKFNELGKDFASYVYLYLPSSFNKIGDYSLYETKFKYVYGESESVEIGNHAFESSSLVVFDIPITKVGDYAFKDCFELLTVDIVGNTISSGKQTSIGEYAFYNCKKLMQITSSAYDTVEVPNGIGEYAFYNCVSLGNIDLYVEGNIGKYAFYNTSTLNNLNNSKLTEIDSIGKYAFYGSGIHEITFGSNLDVISESTFENCRNLTTVTLNRGRIESRAFWNSNVESLTVSSNTEYIAEDAFAYTPMKNAVVNGIGNYKSVYGLGIIEVSTNKLIIGSTNARGASNTNITEDVTEIGNYAFTGNNNLNKITIPENITKVGDYAFKDCYQLSEVYMLGNSIDIGNESFTRSYEGEITDENLKIYVYKDSLAKQTVISKNLNYRNIDPDEIIVTGYENTYKALSSININNLSVKLIYHEEEDREEVLGLRNFSTVAPISNGVGFIVSYQTDKIYQKFQYGDTYFIVEAKNALGYLSTQNVNVTIEKATPNYTVPEGLTANLGQELSEIVLTEGFEWMNPTQVITEAGEQTFKAKYIPTDTNNYEIVENIDIQINVSNSKNTIIPNIQILNKTYDGSTNIDLDNIIISNLNNDEYIIKSVTLNSSNVGNAIATIVLRLSDNKFINYMFEGGAQEKEFNVNVEVVPQQLTKPTVVEKTYTYDGEEQTIELNDFDSNKMNVVGNKRTNAGTQNVTISLKDSNYVWSDNTFADITLTFTINKAEINVEDNTSNATFAYDNLPHILTLNINNNDEFVIRYMDNNEEYTLTECPSYKDIGVYTIKYKVYIDENYTEYFGQKTLKIEETTSYTINNYSVDETNKYISKIMVNTPINTFTSNFTLGYGYGVDVDYKEIDNQKVLYTGGKTRITHGLDLYAEYTNVVIGDINGDGSINSADLLKIRQHLLGINILSGVYFLSSDINYDDNINSADLLRVRQHLLGIKPIE